MRNNGTEVSLEEARLAGKLDLQYGDLLYTTSDYGYMEKEGTKGGERSEVGGDRSLSFLFLYLCVV